MLLTDGAVENYEAIFTKYNAKKKVRVFTYIIGRDVKNSEPVKWMACNNKGYYAQIATLADVKINIMQYIHVLSRPMVIEREYQYKWTNVYMDVGSAGLRLMTTVSIPAFDHREENIQEGNLLGVAGVDVPISEMNKFTPSFQLGFNGYTFAITNNGYIIFHPDLRPKYKTNKGREEDKPNYNSVDLSEVEMYDWVEERVQNRTDNTWTTVIKDKDKLRTKIVNSDTGNHTLFNVVYQVSDWTRAALRDMDYFFTPLKQTPFRLGIALDRHFGMTEFRLKGMNPQEQEKMDAFKYTSPYSYSYNNYNYQQNTYNSQTSWADYLQLDSVNTTCSLAFCTIYCRFEEGEKERDQLNAIKQQVFQPPYSSTGEPKCEEEIVRMVVEDAVLTYRFQKNHWNQRLSNRNKQHQYDARRDQLEKWKNSVVADFVGTRSGLLRYQINKNSLLKDKLQFNESPLHAEYFKIPASAYSLTKNENILVFWIPTTKQTTYGGYSPIEVTSHQNILAVAKLVFAKDSSYNYNSRAGGGGREMYYNYKKDPNNLRFEEKSEPIDTSKAISSVVGMYLDLDYAFKVFNLSIGQLDKEANSKEDDNNMFTKIESCTHSPHIDCYILDHHGYVHHE
ncbi:voltage-dependent calcium channel subunit alpha-2/delta-4-like [Convolutriloba macropyga]|uniref:voltage-dependent calcium channel subunit alpha-2/delta-4-like n=1 Tax=Convolutriloba macropyga TaxID=536237 RepID=UPI003F520E4D